MRRFATLALGLALTPGAALRADQSLVFTNYCSTGSFQVCASVGVKLLTLPDGNTQVAFAFKNLQGAPGMARQPSLLYWISVGFGSGIPSDVYDPNPQDLTVDYTGVGVTGQPDWDFNLYPTGFLLSGPPTDSGLFGCDADPDGTHTIGRSFMGTWQTCDALGHPGYVTLSFTTSQAFIWDPATMEIELGFVGQGGGATCTINVNCFPTRAVTVTPEPRSVALLGTGLLLLPLLAFRRRN
jgi:hypothetical protein